MTPLTSPGLTELLRSARTAERGDQYAGVELRTATRIAGLLWLLAAGGEAGMIVIALLTPGPSPAGGTLRVVLTVLLVLGAAACGLGLLRREYPLGPRALLAHPAAGVLQVLALGILVGGHLGILELLLGWVVFVAALHPARIMVGFTLVSQGAAIAASVPFHGELRPVLDHALLWNALALLAFLLLRLVRSQRVDLRRRAQDADRLARVDALTGLGNRRALDLAIEREGARAERAEADLALIVCDLDHFKAVNDRAGHEAGDACLQGVAAVLRRELRRPDLAFRWGGDEFVLLLPETGRDGAAQVVARVQRATAAEVHRPDGSSLTLTSGIAALEPGHTARDALAAADAALLGAKRGDTNPSGTPEGATVGD